MSRCSDFCSAKTLFDLHQNTSRAATVVNVNVTKIAAENTHQQFTHADAGAVAD